MHRFKEKSPSTFDEARAALAKRGVSLLRNRGKVKYRVCFPGDGKDRSLYSDYLSEALSDGERLAKGGRKWLARVETSEDGWRVRS